MEQFERWQRLLDAVAAVQQQQQQQLQPEEDEQEHEIINHQINNTSSNHQINQVKLINNNNNNINKNTENNHLNNASTTTTITSSAAAAAAAAAASTRHYHLNSINIKNNIPPHPPAPSTTSIAVVPAAAAATTAPTTTASTTTANNAKEYIGPYRRIYHHHSGPAVGGGVSRQIFPGDVERGSAADAPMTPAFGLRQRKDEFVPLNITTTIINNNSNNAATRAANFSASKPSSATTQGATLGTSPPPPQLLLSRPVVQGYRRAQTTAANSSTINGPTGRIGGGGGASVTSTSNYGPRSAAGSSSDRTDAIVRRAASLFSFTTASRLRASSSAAALESRRRQQLTTNPTIPFRSMSNALRLHIVYNVLANDERIRSWATGSVIRQMPYTATKLPASAVTGRPQPRSANSAPHAAYLLLTDTTIHIFRLKMLGFEDPADDTAGQVRYTANDPRLLLKLIAKIPLAAILRIDVGAQRQHITIHHVVRAAPPQQQQRTSDAAESPAPSLPPSIASYVFLTRDPAMTSELLTHLSTDAASLHIFENDHWIFRSMQDSLFLRAGIRPATSPQATLGLDNPSSTDSGWIVKGLKEILQSFSGTRKFLVPRTPSAATAHVSIPEIPDIDFNDPATAPAVYTLGAWIIPVFNPSATTTNTAALSPEPLPAVTDTVTETGTSSTSADSEPHAAASPSPPPQQQPPVASLSIHSVCVVATADILYLASERFDVWPPPLFPPETQVPATVNACFPRHGDDDTADDAIKGLTADRVPQFAPVAARRISDIRRCERWRSWRWRTGHVRQLVNAHPAEQHMAFHIQNGVVGPILADASAGAGGGGGGGAAAASDACTVATSTGWPWWVRVRFAGDDGRDDDASCFWDLGFASIAAADALLEHVARVLGVGLDDEEWFVLGDD